MKTKVELYLREYGKKELDKLGISSMKLKDLIAEGIDNIPFSKVTEGKEADEFFVLEKGTEYTYCVIGNFIGLVDTGSDRIIVNELPREILEGCTAYQVDLILQGSAAAPFSLKSKIEKTGKK